MKHELKEQPAEGPEWTQHSFDKEVVKLVVYDFLLRARKRLYKKFLL